MAATSAQPNPTSSAAATTHTAAATHRRRTPTRSPLHPRTAGGGSAVIADFRSSNTSARHTEHRQPGEQEGDRLWSLGCPVHRDLDRTLGRRKAPPVEAAIDELRRTQVLAGGLCPPGVVESLAEHQPTALAAPVDRRRPAGPVDRRHLDRRTAGGRCGRLRTRQHDTIDLQPGARRRLQFVRAILQRELRLAEHRLDRAPGKQVGDRGNDLHGTGVPSMASRSSRQPVSRSAGRTVRVPADSSLIAAGRATGSP